MHLLGNQPLKGLLQLLGCLLVITGINAILVRMEINNALMAGWCGNESTLFLATSHCSGCLQALVGIALLVLLNHKKLIFKFKGDNKPFNIQASI